MSFNWNGYLYVLAKIGAVATADHFDALGTSRLSYLPRIFPGWEENGPGDGSGTIEGDLEGPPRTDASLRRELFTEIGSSQGNFTLLHDSPFSLVHGFAPGVPPSGDYLSTASRILKTAPSPPPFSFQVSRITPCYSISTHIYGKSIKTGESNVYWCNIPRVLRLLISKPPNTESLTLISFFATLGLCVLAGAIDDGPALTAIVMISLCTSWRFYTFCKLFRAHRRILDRCCGQQYILARTAQHALHLLIFDHIWAGKITLNAEIGLAHRQTFPWIYRAQTRLGYFDAVRLPILLLAALLYSTSQLLSQVTIASSYLIITCLYWTIPPSDRGPNFNVTRLFPPGTRDLHLPNLDLRSSEAQPSLARTLWHAIAVTGSTSWVYNLGAAPKTAGWDQWLREAKKNAHEIDWPANAEKLRLVDGEDHVYDNEQDEDLEQRSNPRASSEIAPVDESFW